MIAVVVVAVGLASAAAVYAAQRWNEIRRNRPEAPPTVIDRFLEMVRQGRVAEAVEWLRRRRVVVSGPQYDNLERVRAEETWSQDRFDLFVRPILEAGRGLIARIVFLVFLSAVGIYAMMVQYQLDTAVIHAGGYPEGSAKLMGAILAVGLSVMGTLVAFVVTPGEAFPVLKEFPHRTPMAAGLAGMWLAVVLILATRAPIRAHVTLGAAGDRAEAVCLEANGDAAASPAERAIACGASKTAGLRLQTASDLDQLITVVVAITEAAGAWGLLRLAEYAFPAWAAAGLRRARRRRLAAEAAVRDAEAQFQAQVGEALVETEITVADLEAAAPPGGPPPAEDGPETPAAPPEGPPPAEDEEGPDGVVPQPALPPTIARATNGASATGGPEIPGPRPPSAPEPPESSPGADGAGEPGARYDRF